MSDKQLQEQTNSMPKQESNIIFDIIKTVLHIPGVRVDRNDFLLKQLRKNGVSEDQIDCALTQGVKATDISVDILNKIADGAIRKEVLECSSTSFVAGLPGGLAMLGTIPADISQYYFHSIRIIQKLAYLYGWPDFDITNKEVSDASIGAIVILLGVMSGVGVANEALKNISKLLVNQALTKLPKMALTKGALFPLVKQIAKSIGVKVTKSTFSKSLSKAIPIIGGVVSGAITFAGFMPSCKLLQKKLQQELLVQK